MRPCLAEYTTMKAPPPMPDDCGSTRFSTSCAAMAASTTLPPRRSISSPASVASGLAATIMKCGALTRLRARVPVAASGLRSSVATGERAQADGIAASAAASRTAAQGRMRMTDSRDGAGRPA